MFDDESDYDINSDFDVESINVNAMEIDEVAVENPPAAQQAVDDVPGDKKGKARAKGPGATALQSIPIVRPTRWPLVSTVLTWIKESMSDPVYHGSEFEPAMQYIPSDVSVLPPSKKRT